MSSGAGPASYRFGHCELQPGQQRLLVEGQAVAVGPRALDLLVALVERAGELVSKDELLARVWPKLVVEENNLQVRSRPCARSWARTRSLLFRAVATGSPCSSKGTLRVLLRCPQRQSTTCRAP